MSFIEATIQSYEFNRSRTLALLDRVDSLDDPQAAFGWRPGPERAHSAWQIMHIAITEEIFASERLDANKPSEFTNLWPRFRGGSTPDDDIPTTQQVRDILAVSRERLRDTIRQFQDSQLDEVEIAIRDRRLSLRTALQIIGWHESHHQGQAHLTLNLYEARN